MDARIDRQIARFEPIGLEELNRASALMKRLERKYVLDAGMLPDFLGALAGDFRILVIDGRTRHRYQSSYFDTADLMCFRAHNQQRPNRFKLRARHYVDSGLQFLELKEKTRVSETSKSRIALGTSHQPVTLDQALAQIIGAKGLSPDDFQTSLVVGYDRLTLSQKDAPCRITIDLNVSFRAADSEQSAVIDKCIVEVKSGTRMSLADRLLRDRGYRAKSPLSKYCIGIVACGLHRKNSIFHAAHALLTSTP